MRLTFRDALDWQFVWDQEPPKTEPDHEPHIAKIAQRVGHMLEPFGFRHFHNGGTPLLERRFGDLRQEVVFNAAPEVSRRVGAPFSVKIHLGHYGVQRVRSNYWRPSSRAPLVVASADSGLLEVPPVYVIWMGAGEDNVAAEIARHLDQVAIPWFEIFEEPELMRDRILSGAIPLIDDSTALELLLAEFGPADARRFLRKWRANEDRRRVVDEPSGYQLEQDRVATIASYYRLG